MNRSTHILIATSFCEAPVQLECSVASWIWKLVAPVIVLLGIVGNCLVFVVLSRRKLRALPTVTYLLFLAAADLTFLIGASLRHILMNNTGTDILNLSIFNCVTHLWVVYTSGGTSPWLVVLLTVERACVSVCPTARPTRKRALIACVTLVTLVSLSTGFLLFAFDLETVNEIITGVNGTITTQQSAVCLPRTIELSIFLSNTWGTIIFGVFNLLPFIIIALGNATIMAKIIQQRKRLRSQVQPDTDASSTRDRKWNSVNKMVLLVSVFFLLSTIPYTSFAVIKSRYFKDVTDIKTVARLQLGVAITTIGLYLNYACNFWLYFASGSLFKEEWQKFVSDISNASRRIRDRLMNTNDRVINIEGPQ